MDKFKRYSRVGLSDDDNDDGDDDDKKMGQDKDKGKGKGGFTVQDCLDKFVESEQMAPEETFYCR